MVFFLLPLYTIRNFFASPQLYLPPIDDGESLTPRYTNGTISTFDIVLTLKKWYTAHGRFFCWPPLAAGGFVDTLAERRNSSEGGERDA